MTIIGRRLARRLAIRLGLEPATRPPALLPELTRFFLGELIQERTRYLAVPAQRPGANPTTPWPIYALTGGAIFPRRSGADKIS